ncbi:MAG TPA: hypothetical protein VFP22_04860 [Candidatus Limnocylindrales bacterium]|nr:hypothetical protein [Candidatus Limnocylindrales bacterium]
MGGILESIAQGVGGLFAGVLVFIGQTLRGIAAALDQALPGGMLAAAVFVVLLIGAWQLAKR